MGFLDGFAAAVAAAGIPPWLVIALVALLPFVEMRGAVPIAFFVFHWTIADALLFTAPISLVPGLVIALYMDRLEPTLRKVKLFDRLLTKAFAWTRKKNTEPEEKKKRDRRAMILLALLIAIPGPGTGAWTGGLVSYVFDVPKRRATIAIILGVLGEAAGVGFLVLVLGWSISSL